MTTVIKFTLIVLLIYYGLKLVAQATLGYFVRKVQNQQQEIFRQQNRADDRPVGDIRVEKQPPRDQKTRVGEESGDYIDFEEVD